ncbi:hypothetical protein LCGC14_3076020, partial [marine sediment metagenome]
AGESEDSVSYERLPWKWLPIYVLSCSILPGIFFSAATHWSVELGLVAGVFGAVLGALGWAFMGVRTPNPYSSLAEAYSDQLDKTILACNLGLGWKSQALEASALLLRARPYVGRAPFEGSLTVEQDIEEFLDRTSGRGEE